jgi:hypothetical protein
MKFLKRLLLLTSILLICCGKLSLKEDLRLLADVDEKTDTAAPKDDTSAPKTDADPKPADTTKDDKSTTTATEDAKDGEKAKDGEAPKDGETTKTTAEDKKDDGKETEADDENCEEVDGKEVCEEPEAPSYQYIDVWVETDNLPGCGEVEFKLCPYCCIGQPYSCTNDTLHCPIERN